MFEFSTEGGATLAYAVDFATAAYANISFFDASQVTIPFHLSLRAERGLAVVNRREGNLWQAEEAVDAPFRPGVNRVELVFEAGRITVRLNGAGLFDLGPDTMPGLAAITSFSWQGAILPGSVQPGGGAQAGRRGRGELSFTGPFELSGWGFEPGAEALDLAIGVAGLAEPPVTLLSDRPEIARREGAPGRRIGVQAVLPGRVWQGVAPGAALTFIVASQI